MQKMTLKSYAVKNKMSLFSVVKLVKSGKLKSVLEKENGLENGKDVTYILVDDVSEIKVQQVEKVQEEGLAFDIEKEVKALILEVKALKEEMDRLKSLL